MCTEISIIILSDTHKNTSNAIDIINAAGPDYVFHLGDMWEDAELLEEIFTKVKFVCVAGNCDWPSMTKAPDERVLELGGLRIMMCHGHTYGVKQGAERYLSAARAKKADIALFGHTHNPLCDRRGDVLLLNPGSVSTYGWLKISQGKFTAGIKRFEENI